MKEQKLRCSVHVVGMKKRCRKAARHSLDMGHFEPGTPEGLLISIAKQHLLTEMKSFDKASLSIVPVEIERNEWGTSESFRICDPNAKRVPLSTEAAHA